MNKKYLVVALAIGVLLSAGTAFADATSSNSQQCPQGWTWNGSNCQVNQQSCTAAGGSWNNTTASCSFSGSSGGSGQSTTGQTQPPPPPPQPSSSGSGPCPLGQYFMGGACVTAAQACAAGGGTWANNTCQGPTGTSTQPFGMTPPTQPPPQQQTPQQLQQQQPQNQTMSSDMKRMAKMIGIQVRGLTRVSKRLGARGLLMPTSCNATLARAQDPQALSDCTQIGQLMLSAPTLVSTLKRSISQIKKNADMQSEYETTLVPLYAKIKSGTATDDDMQAFLDTANDLIGQVEDALAQTDTPPPGIFFLFDAFGGRAIPPPPPMASTTAQVNRGSLLGNVYEAFVRFFTP